MSVRTLKTEWFPGSPEKAGTDRPTVQETVGNDGAARAVQELQTPGIERDRCRRANTRPRESPARGE